MATNGSHYIICRHKTLLDSKIFSKNYLQWADIVLTIGDKESKGKRLFLSSTLKKLSSTHAALF